MGESGLFQFMTAYIRQAFRMKYYLLFAYEGLKVSSPSGVGSPGGQIMKMDFKILLFDKSIM
jgi:hypothetical protein